jgi:hypothetical protein
VKGPARQLAGPFCVCGAGWMVSDVWSPGSPSLRQDN